MHVTMGLLNMTGWIRDMLKYSMVGHKYIDDNLAAFIAYCNSS